MMRVFGGLDLGPIHVEPRFVPAEQWDAWRRGVRPWLRLAAAAVVIDLLLVWAIVVYSVIVRLKVGG